MRDQEPISETVILIRCPTRVKDELALLAKQRKSTSSQVLRDLISSAFGCDGERRPPPTGAAVA